MRKAIPDVPPWPMGITSRFALVLVQSTSCQRAYLTRSRGQKKGCNSMYSALFVLGSINFSEEESELFWLSIASRASGDWLLCVTLVIL